MSSISDIDFRAAQRFMIDLSANNNREWFTENKKRYEADVKAVATAFVEAAARPLRAIDEELLAEPKVNRSLFRINRDIRFSKDKRPYKEEVGFRFYVGSPKAPSSALYMRVQPDSAGVATGIWGFDKDQRERWRQAVAGPDGEALASALEALVADGFHISADALKRAPKPWGEEHPRADLLKLKGLVVGYEQPVDVGPGFGDWCVEQWQRLGPVHRWLQQHVS